MLHLHSLPYARRDDGLAMQLQTPPPDQAHTDSACVPPAPILTHAAAFVHRAHRSLSSSPSSTSSLSSPSRLLCSAADDTASVCVAHLSAAMAEQLGPECAVDAAVVLSSLLSALPPSSHPPLLTILHQLTSSLDSCRHSFSSLQSAHSALLTSHSALQSEVSELQDAHLALDKRLWETEMRRRGEEAEWGVRERAMRLQVVEVERRARMVQHRDKQYRHEMNRRELQHAQLSERALQLLADRDRDRQQGTGKDTHTRTHSHSHCHTQQGSTGTGTGRDRDREKRGEAQAQAQPHTGRCSCVINEWGQKEGWREMGKERGQRRGVDVSGRVLQREEEQRAELQRENAAIKAYLLDLDAQLGALDPEPPAHQPPSVDDDGDDDWGVEHSSSQSTMRSKHRSLAELPWRMLERTLHKRLTLRMRAISSSSSSGAATQAGRVEAESPTATATPTPRSPCAQCRPQAAQVAELQRALDEQRALVSSQHALLTSHLFTAPHPVPLSPTTRRLSLDDDLADVLDAHSRSQAVLSRQRAQLDAERAQLEEQRRRVGGGGWPGRRWVTAEVAAVTPSPPSSPCVWDEAEGEEGREDGHERGDGQVMRGKQRDELGGRSSGEAVAWLDSAE